LNGRSGTGWKTSAPSRAHLTEASGSIAQPGNTAAEVSADSSAKVRSSRLTRLDPVPAQRAAGHDPVEFGERLDLGLDVSIDHSAHNKGCPHQWVKASAVSCATPTNERQAPGRQRDRPYGRGAAQQVPGGSDADQGLAGSGARPGGPRHARGSEGVAARAQQPPARRAGAVSVHRAGPAGRTRSRRATAMRAPADEPRTGRTSGAPSRGGSYWRVRPGKQPQRGPDDTAWNESTAGVGEAGDRRGRARRRVSAQPAGGPAPPGPE